MNNFIQILDDLPKHKPGDPSLGEAALFDKLPDDRSDGGVTLVQMKELKGKCLLEFNVRMKLKHRIPDNLLDKAEQFLFGDNKDTNIYLIEGEYLKTYATVIHIADGKDLADVHPSARLKNRFFNEIVAPTQRLWGELWISVIYTSANKNLNEILSVAVRWFGIADTLDLINTVAILRRAREQSFNIPPMENPVENCYSDSALDKYRTLLQDMQPKHPRSLAN